MRCWVMGRRKQVGRRAEMEKEEGNGGRKENQEEGDGAERRGRWGGRGMGKELL